MFGRVYGIVFEGRIIYVGATGQSIKQRKLTHRWTMQHKPQSCPKLYEFMSKHPFDKFEFVLIEECKRDILYERESHYITNFNCISNGFNSEPYKGGAHNPVPGKGREKGCLNPSGADHYAYGDSNATRKAVEASVKARIGKPLSEETKQKMREARAKNTLNAKRVKCVETGEIYASRSLASKAVGVSPTAINSAMRKNCKAGGFHWEYV